MLKFANLSSSYKVLSDSNLTFINDFTLSSLNGVSKSFLEPH